MTFVFGGEGTKVQQFADFILDYIALNNLKAGDVLPSINALSKEFSVSRDTVFKTFSELKSRGDIDSIHGKNYFVASRSHNILLLLDEYSPFKEVLYNTIASKLPTTYKIDLLFHQYNKYLFDKLINESNGKYDKYLVMNYDNDKFSDTLLKIDKRKLLLLDFGNFEKDGYSYVCQDFEQGLYDNLLSIKNELSEYNKLVFVLNRRHKHPPSSKLAFSQFCLDHNFEFEVIDEMSENANVQKDHFYLVIKNEDIVNLIKQGQLQMLRMGKDYGLLAYNENPFYEVVEKGISSIGVDWRKMGEFASEFVINDKKVQTYIPTTITKRNSF